ncbi:MAG: tRNA uridine-5-carboxymethylaminomethyl(34) synthesis enzyme MnmG [candidate division WOR-3 bacterium]|nr:MAG: tRNA uridine-5-carboxymethylaminomethyl(34) synthesis enzyme MnmG [candidate division WOR-3 bacterium]
MTKTQCYDIIVVGGGHAGIEASLAASRMGFEVLLITLNIDTIGQMSCNPSIGGLAKGHLVREVDAIGGEIGLLADRTALQFRMLNRSKGPAVWSPRSQNDRVQYKLLARQILEQAQRITIKQEEVQELLVSGGSVIGVQTGIGNEYRAHAVIVTTGTFLNGLMHIGLDSMTGGRLAESSANRLSNSLQKCGLKLGRLKTGTSPRIARHSIDFSILDVQYGDEEPSAFSLRSGEILRDQEPCYITHTNPETHALIQGGLDRSPLYTGKITGVGPRYCPSIETKVVRFSGRDSHLVFIEPEGRDSGECYLNGLATSLPYDIQMAMLRSIKGLSTVEITRPGYAVEYDFVYPVQLHPNLETKKVKRLFCAGQINGTSGYEEAAAQGIIAGINAALCIRDEKPFVLKRYEAYIGVLIDDLITKNTEEPYRMFTSLAEHRLILRTDNVADRVMQYGNQYGLIPYELWQRFQDERHEIDRTVDTLRSTVVKPEAANPVLRERGESELPGERGGQSLYQILKRPNMHYQDIQQIAELHFDKRIGTRVEIEAKYEGYIKREQELIARLQELEHIMIPQDFEFQNIKGLSNEARTKLTEVRPENLDQASRIQGVSPADVLVLLLYIKKET